LTNLLKILPENFKERKELVIELTFSRLIIQILQDQNLNLTQLYKELYDLGLNITYASLYGYYTGKMIPPFSKAKEILKIEKIEIDDAELEAILEQSRQVQKAENSQEDKILNLNLKIKPELVDGAYRQQAKYLRSVIEMRADELFGDENLVTQFSASGKRKISSYVAYLIKKDLEESGLLEVE